MERKRRTPLTISLPPELLAKLDYLRNDVSRSRYMEKLVLQHVKLMEL